MMVTIAIVSWNTRDLLDVCLASMQDYFERGVADVWVLDNGSTDGSPEMVREKHPWARLLISEENLGYGQAVNLIAAKTSTKWIAPSNADIELTPGALDALIAAGAIPGTAIVGPRLILRDGSTQPAVQPFPGVRAALLRNLALYKVSRQVGARLCLAGYWNPDQPAVVDWISGAFLLVRRDVFDAVGGFDERQWMYAEDLDLCWRTRQHGWHVRYEPSARVHHALSVAAEQAFGDVERRHRRMMRANYEWLASRRGRTRAWQVAATEVLLLRLRILLFGALERVFPGRWERRRVDTIRMLRRHEEGTKVLRHSYRARMKATS